MNLLQETIETLESRGHTLDDIEAVQGGTIRISVEHFKELADKEYDDGYGSQHVARDLTLIMKDGSWYTRWEYDGSEGWEHHRRPVVLPETSDDKVGVIVDNRFMWETVASMNEEVSD